MPKPERWDAVVSARPRVRVADAVALARVSNLLYMGAVGVGRDRLDVDVDLELGLLRVAHRHAGDLVFLEARLVMQRMPRGGTRARAYCVACDRRALVVFISEDNAHLVCGRCARVRQASRALSNERRYAWGASRLLARAGAADVDLLDEDAALHVPLAQRARMEKYLARFLERHGDRAARAMRIVGRSAHRIGISADDLRTLWHEVSALVQELMDREQRTGRYDRGIARVCGTAAEVLHRSVLLSARTEPTYWRRIVETKSGRKIARGTPDPENGPQGSAPAEAVSVIADVTVVEDHGEVA